MTNKYFFRLWDDGVIDPAHTRKDPWIEFEGLIK